jgi:hypothetical protein
MKEETIRGDERGLHVDVLSTDITDATLPFPSPTLLEEVRQIPAATHFPETPLPFPSELNLSMPRMMDAFTCRVCSLLLNLLPLLHILR